MDKREDCRDHEKSWAQKMRKIIFTFLGMKIHAAFEAGDESYGFHLLDLAQQLAKQLDGIHKNE